LLVTWLVKTKINDIIHLQAKNKVLRIFIPLEPNKVSKRREVFTAATTQPHFRNYTNVGAAMQNLSHAIFKKFLYPTITKSPCHILGISIGKKSDSRWKMRI